MGSFLWFISFVKSFILFIHLFLISLSCSFEFTYSSLSFFNTAILNYQLDLCVLWVEPVVRELLLSFANGIFHWHFKFECFCCCYIHIHSIYIFYLFIDLRMKKDRKTDLLFHLFMHPLVASCMCPDQGQTLNLGVEVQGSNHPSYPASTTFAASWLGILQLVSLGFLWSFLGLL